MLPPLPRLASPPSPAQPRKAPPPPAPATEAPTSGAPAFWLDRWARVQEEARKLGGDNANLGRLLWVNRQCFDRAQDWFAMPEAWIRHYSEFYASDAFEDVARVGLRGIKSETGATAAATETVLMPRTLSSAVNARCPILSSNVKEASDRFTTIRVVLRAMGFKDFLGRGPVPLGEFKCSGGGMSAQIIQLHDAQGHEVKFQVSAASESAAAGFTGIAGLGDELDLWGRSDGSNPAANVLRVLRSRYTTQPQAKLHLFSASYERDSEHARLIKLGSKPGRRVARIGEEGAAADYAARMRLADLHGLTDETLLAPPLSADSPDIPSWVTNPGAPIEEAYAKSADLREMFALYGGRGATDGGTAELPIILEGPRSNEWAGADPRQRERYAP